MSESSTESELEDQVTTPQGDQPDAKVTSEESSTSEKGEKGDMLSAVKAALEPKETSPASDEPGSKTETEPKADAVGDAKGDGSADLSEEELNRLKPKTRERIEYLSHQVKDRDTKIADLAPKAERYDGIQRFVDDAGLSKEDVNGGFDIMRNLKSNPLKAYDQLRPIVDQLETVLGIALPADLQQAVQRGEITDAHARELSRSRSTAAVNGRMLEEREQRMQRDTEQRQFQGQVNDVAAAATEWENSKSKGDPDWKLKGPRVQQAVELEILRRQQSQPGYFPSKDEAIKMSEDALKQVDTELKRLAPQRRQVKQPSADAGSTTSVAKPKTMLEAAKQGLARATG